MSGRRVFSGAVTLCVLSFGIAQARAEETATQKQKGSPNPAAASVKEDPFADVVPKTAPENITQERERSQLQTFW
jgi:hypothetical protein